MIDKEKSDGPAGDDTGLDALMAAADQGMLDAIRASLDLDAGFAQVLGSLESTVPPAPLASASETRPCNCGNVSQPTGAPHRIGQSIHVSTAANRKQAWFAGILVAAVFALIISLNVAVLVKIGRDRVSAFPQAGANAPCLPFKPPANLPMKPIIRIPRDFRGIPSRGSRPLITIVSGERGLIVIRSEVCAGTERHLAVQVSGKFLSGTRASRSRRTCRGRPVERDQDATEDDVGVTCSSSAPDRIAELGCPLRAVPRPRSPIARPWSS